MKKMKVVLLDGTRNFKVEFRDIPDIKDDEALVEVKAVGICGSDIHYYEKGRIGRYVVESPLILDMKRAERLSRWDLK